MKKYYITTSIAYINARPHIGYAMELVQADALARYYRAREREVFFLTGTDEHGAKVGRIAEEAGQTYQAYADAAAKPFQDLTKLLDTTHDRFIRTTDADHVKAVQAIWKSIEHDLYKATYTGLYCTGCEAFYTEKEADEGKCPIHHTPLEKISEENYFFRLSKYTDRIKKAITDDEYKVTPLARKNEILAVLESGLEDISFSRPADKVKWGVPVPGDEQHVMYVWPDALSNYITGIGYPDAAYQKFWPADLHVIGKDILRFHAAIWPGILLSLGLPLPHGLLVHGFIQSGGQKMSKSLGNVIDPAEVVEKYGLDALRYYLLHEIPTQADGDFTWERFERVYNADLANELGNLVSRTVAMITKYLDGQYDDIPKHTHDVKAYDDAVADLRLDKALDEAWALVKELNQLIDEEKPWLLAKETDKSHLGEVLMHIVTDLRLISDLLEPFLPDTATKIRSTFAPDRVNPFAGMLFPKIENETVPDSDFHVTRVEADPETK